MEISERFSIELISERKFSKENIMTEGDASEVADRLRFHVEALTIELGLPRPERLRGVEPMSPLSIDRHRVATAKAWIAIGVTPGRAFDDAALFANPALNLLLDLYVSRAEDRDVYVTSACIAAGVPPTTGLRWIERLVSCGYLVRQPDGSDGRRMLVSISDAGRDRMAVALDAAMETDRRPGLGRKHTFL